MLSSRKSWQLWISLIFVAGVPRILAAFLLPNAFGDAYSYIKEVDILSHKISDGSFSLTDLYGFWLPFYQLVSACLTTLFGHPFYVAKVVSALFGVGVCLLVYAISYRLTHNRTASLVAFALVALNPLHIVNSASAMTDLPNAFLVLACVYFAIERRWLLAALMGALAGLTRVDSWMLVVLIPALELFEERRLPVATTGILLFPPLFWFYISWKATGDWLACFAMRKQYMDALFVANPSLASFSLYGVARDAFALLLSSDVAVLAASIAGLAIVIERITKSRNEIRSIEFQRVLIVQIVYFAFLGFITLAYLTHKQPIIFHRYGLILFALGAPMLPWSFLQISRVWPEWKNRLLIIIATTCFIGASIQIAYTVGYINRVAVSRAIADSIRNKLSLDKVDARVFNDDGEVFALAQLPDDAFRSSSTAPKDRAGFLAYLLANNIQYMVFDGRQESTPVRLFPELSGGRGNEFFQPIAHAGSSFLKADMWLYRVVKTQQ